MLGNNLAYVALVVTDVEATASVFAQCFGLQKTTCPKSYGTTPPFQEQWH